MEDENNEKQKTNTEEKPLSIVDEARAIRDEIFKYKEELRQENDRKEKIQANEMLGSSAGGHIEPTSAKEETAKEYSDRVMKGDLK